MSLKTLSYIRYSLKNYVSSKALSSRTISTRKFAITSGAPVNPSILEIVNAQDNFSGGKLLTSIIREAIAAADIIDVPDPANTLRLLLVGGGASGAGNGGNTTAASGGGGGVLPNQLITYTPGVTYTIRAGNGGAGTGGDLAQGRLGNPGGYSQFDTYYASGGYPGAYGAAGASGTTGTTTPGGGNAGGGSHGGGGGAGAAASNANGGIGLDSPLYNQLVGYTYYLGGGAACAAVIGSGGYSGVGTPGASGGGDFPGTTAGSNSGTLGGGGAAGAWNTSSQGSGPGGGGLVLIRLPSSVTVTSTTGSPTITTIGNYKFYVWYGITNSGAGTGVSGSITI